MIEKQHAVQLSTGSRNPLSLVLAASLILGSTVSLAARELSPSAEHPSTQQSSQTRSKQRKYHYHRKFPKLPLAPTLEPSEVERHFPTFQAAKTAVLVYWTAGHIKEVLYQMPCFCGCDRSKGHGSLYDCFTGFHGIGCGTCQMEAVFVFEQLKLKKRPAQIREALERGEWSVNLSGYVDQHYDEYLRTRCVPKSKADSLKDVIQP